MKINELSTWNTYVAIYSKMEIEKSIFAYKTSRVLSVEDKRNILYSNLQEKNEVKGLKF